MSVTRVAPRGFGFVCRSCQLKQLRTPSRSLSRIALIEPSSRRKATRLTEPSKSSLRRYAAHAATASFPSRLQKRTSNLPAATSTPTPKQPTARDPNPIQTLSSLRSDVSHITSANIVPDELSVAELLNRIYEFSNVIIFGQPEVPTEAEIEQASTSTSTVLDDLDDAGTSRNERSVSHENTAGNMSLSFRKKAADTLCEMIYKLVSDPKVFISPEILGVYTRVQCLLGKPEYLPEIFHLYANKPHPVPNSSPIRYKNSWPNAPKNAVPMDLADAALEAAIQKKDMPLAIAIIDTTVATKAYRRQKLIRKATLPALAVSSTPLIAYAGAKWLSTYQNVWDEDMAIYTTMAGSLAYIGTLSTIGYVAITTWNDQMQRVTWAIGTPMTQRWLREEERMYFDRIALAWGFQERWRRGEEQGEEWEGLREECGVRSMVLDRTELMDGME